jgi:lipopolysaccharide export LptBFGC system permease protein LptF
MLFAQLFFLYVPWWVAATAVAIAYVVSQIRKQIAAKKEQKLQKLDEEAIQEILGAEDAEASNSKKQAALQAAKTKKAKNKVQQRLAQERKAENRSSIAQAGTKKKKKGGGDEEEEVDETDLIKFAKGSRQAKTKNQ